MPENIQPLRFAVLLDLDTVKKWQYDCILKLYQSEHAHLLAFYINDSDKKSKSGKNSVGFRLLERSIRHKGPLSLVNLRDKFKNIPFISLKTKGKGYSTYPEQSALETVEKQKLDFMLRFGFGILRGKILQLPKYGVWSFHHGNPEKFRGGPAGFWEIYKNESTTGAILQVLKDELDAGKIIKSGNFRTVKHSYKESFYHLLESTIHWPLIAVRDIVLNNKTSFSTQQKKGPIYKVPGNFKMALFICKLAINRLKLYDKLLFKAEMWKVGIVDQKIEDFVKEEKIKPVKWISSPQNNSYWADPFPYSNSEFLVEEYDYRTGLGCIKKINESGESQHYLQQPTHLSYPFTLEHNNTRYILPENGTGNAVTLFYEHNNQVTRKKTLIQGAWIDPTLFFHHNTWWLFCTAGNAPNEELHLFFSNQIDGNYESHPLNPIIQDVENARPGGALFKIGNDVYRPAQKCSEVYGESIHLNKIVSLSKTDYKEVRIKSILATSVNRELEGLHTLNSFGDKTLIDAKTTGFNSINFKHQLQLKLKKIIR